MSTHRDRLEEAGMTLERFRLDGKVALVTGAGGGIGKASALALKEAGATVVGADLGGADEVIDVSDRSAVHDLVERVVSDHGRLDVLANVAGVIENAPVAALDEETVDRVLAVNLKGALFGCQAALGPMTDAGGGAIVNMASAGAFVPTPTLGAYAMSKAGVVALTRTLAVEAGPLGIRVNAVAPGFIVTPMTERLGQLDDEILAGHARHTPLKRVGEVDDVAAAVLYLASDAAHFVTGQVIHANGGVLMA
jgi:3-oxoacyl-[acyl-carrier protein] reductase